MPVESVGRITRLRPRPIAADVDARHLHGRRHRQQRPHVAAIRERLKLLELEVLLHTRAGGVNDWRCARHGHRFLQRGEAEFDVHIRREAQRDLYAITLQRVEAG